MTATDSRRGRRSGSALSKDLGTWITEYRRQRDITQVELGAILGWPQSVIARLEAGQREPSFSTIRRLASALNVTITITTKPGSSTLSINKTRRQAAHPPLPSGDE